MNKFSKYIREFIGLYSWQMNIRSVNRQYLHNLYKDIDPSLTVKINDYYKFYNWRTYCRCASHDRGFYSTIPCITKGWWGYKINVKNAFGRKKGECYRKQCERIKRECPDLPKRYFYSVLPSDIESFKKISLTKRFSPLIRGHINFYLWQMNIRLVNLQYLQNFTGFGQGSSGRFFFIDEILGRYTPSPAHAHSECLITDINGYVKVYNWRIIGTADYYFIVKKINVGNAFGYKPCEDYYDKIKIARIKRECPDVPRRYFYTVLPSDLSV